MTYRTEHALGEPALAALEPAWWRLWHSVPRSTPFQTPAWQLAWWRTFGSGQPLAITVWQADELCALLPFFVFRSDNGVRRLLLLGTGNSDRLDPLITGTLPHDVLRRAVASLRDHASRWDVCDLNRLRPRSPLTDACPRGWRQERSTQDGCPVLAIDPAQPLDTQLPTHIAASLRCHGRRAEGEGVRVVAATNRADVARLLAALADLHAARGRERDKPGVLADCRVRSFHTDVAPSLLELDALQLFALEHEGRTIAVHYGFAGCGRAWYYVGGFSPDAAHLAPATLLVGSALNAAHARGCRVFVFLRGAECCRQRWGATYEAAARVRLTFAPAGACTETAGASAAASSAGATRRRRTAQEVTRV